MVGYRAARAANVYKTAEDLFPAFAHGLWRYSLSNDSAQDRAVKTISQSLSKRKRVLIVTYAVLTVAGCVVAYELPEGYWREISLLEASVFLGILVPEAIGIISGGIENRKLGIGLRTSVVLTVVSLFLATYWGLSYRAQIVPAPYPISNGIIADFAGGPGGPARSIFGLHFTPLSDSAWNLQSKVWFTRIDLPTDLDGAFLRINYELISQETHEPYVGVFTDFTLPPEKPFDVSAFKGVSMRIRLGQAMQLSPIALRVILYSSNVVNYDYAYPEYEVRENDLTESWVYVKMPFEDFGKPPYEDVPYDIRVDPTRVFRIGLVVVGHPNQTTHGYLDVDDIRFYP